MLLNMLIYIIYLSGRQSCWKKGEKKFSNDPTISRAEWELRDMIWLNSVFGKINFASGFCVYFLRSVVKASIIFCGFENVVSFFVKKEFFKTSILSKLKVGSLKSFKILTALEGNKR